MRKYATDSVPSYPTKSNYDLKKSLFTTFFFSLCFVFAYGYSGGGPSMNIGNTITSFSGKVNDCKIKLHWGTKHEIGNDFFEIQRSIDGNHFVTIGKVNGSGNSIAPVTYHYSDDQVSKEIYFYRLKLVDFNGDWGYSDIINIATECRREGISIDKIFKTNENWVNVLVFTDKDLPNAQLIVKNSQDKILKVRNAEIKPGGNFVPVLMSEYKKGTYKFIIQNDKSEVASNTYTKK